MVAKMVATVTEHNSSDDEPSNDEGTASSPSIACWSSPGGGMDGGGDRSNGTDGSGSDGWLLL